MSRSKKPAAHNPTAHPPAASSEGRDCAPAEPDGGAGGPGSGARSPGSEPANPVPDLDRLEAGRGAGRKASGPAAPGRSGAGGERLPAGPPGDAKARPPDPGLETAPETTPEDQTESGRRR